MSMASEGRTAVVRMTERRWDMIAHEGLTSDGGTSDIDIGTNKPRSLGFVHRLATGRSASPQPGNSACPAPSSSYRRLGGGAFVCRALRLRRGGLLPALLVVPLLVLIPEADARSPSVSTASAPSITEDWDQEREQPLGPSYDCENAQGSLEHTVCSDPLLSRLDIQVATLFHDRLKAAPVRGADSTAKIPSSALAWGYRDELAEEQRQWLQARDGKCDLSFDFDSGAGAHYTAIPCLIDFYVKRLVDLDSDTSLGEASGRRILDVLVDVGSVALDDMRLDLGNVRIDLPRVLPATSVETPGSTLPHPAQGNRI